VRAHAREVKNTKGKKGKRKRNEGRKDEVKVADERGGVILRRNKTEFMPRRAGRGTYSSFELATLLHLARSRRTN